MTEYQIYCRLLHSAKPFFRIKRKTHNATSGAVFKHTIWSLLKHTSATTYASAIGSERSFSKLFHFRCASRRSSRRLSRLTCRVVGRRVGVWTVTRCSHLPSRPSSHAQSRSRWSVLLAFALVCFTLKLGSRTLYDILKCIKQINIKFNSTRILFKYKATFVT